MLTSGPRARQTCGLALHLPPPPASAFGLRSLWLGLLAVKVLERDDGATAHPWHLTSGALSFPARLPALLFPLTWWLSPCLCLSPPLELGKCILRIKAARAANSISLGPCGQLGSPPPASICQPSRGEQPCNLLPRSNRMWLTRSCGSGRGGLGGGLHRWSVP